MADMRLLERTLHENVTWNRARINFLAVIIYLTQVICRQLNNALASLICMQR